MCVDIEKKASDEIAESNRKLMEEQTAKEKREAMMKSFRMLPSLLSNDEKNDKISSDDEGWIPQNTQTKGTGPGSRYDFDATKVEGSSWTSYSPAQPGDKGSKRDRDVQQEKQTAQTDGGGSSRKKQKLAQTGGDKGSGDDRTPGFTKTGLPFVDRSDTVQINPPTKQDAIKTAQVAYQSLATLDTGKKKKKQKKNDSVDSDDDEFANLPWG